MATKTPTGISSDVSDIDKCNDEVDPRVQVTFQIQIFQVAAQNSRDV
jgi:hypothetical protein